MLPEAKITTCCAGERKSLSDLETQRHAKYMWSRLNVVDERGKSWFVKLFYLIKTELWSIFPNFLTKLENNLPPSSQSLLSGGEQLVTVEEEEEVEGDGVCPSLSGVGVWGGGESMTGRWPREAGIELQHWLTAVCTPPARTARHITNIITATIIYNRMQIFSDNSISWIDKQIKTNLSKLWDCQSDLLRCITLWHYKMNIIHIKSYPQLILCRCITLFIPNWLFDVFVQFIIIIDYGWCIIVSYHRIIINRKVSKLQILDIISWDKYLVHRTLQICH